ncbi:ABC transporter ATP-binding protein [Salinirubellus sp. GCM10025818]|uniref:ABC transporter ATP-binding protein n=1 Tax=Salinirubellus TaxID=2162630 RepID=UPI0030D1A365
MTRGVELEDVSIAFDDVRALADVSLSVEDGEFFTLVGPSGCGKTTTLRAIAGFETPDSGTVRIGGEDVTTTPPEERHVGIVFQSYALFPHMTVRENVGYGLRFRDPPGGVSTRERVDELLDLVDMAGMDDRDPTALSGGQQQRVSLARALAPGPDVLLLDEPLSALDARLRERLRVTVRGIQRDLGITTVYVTHDQAEALAVSDRVAVMNDGRIEQVGTPEAVYREPESRFVAEFVGDNNLLDGEVTSADPPTATVEGVEVRLPPDVALDPGDPVTLSIRPEAVEVVSGTSESGTTLSATVESVEFLGEAYRLHCAWRGHELLVRSDERETPGETIRLGFEPADVRLL